MAGKVSSDPNVFILPDLADELTQIEANQEMTDEDRLQKKEELHHTYDELPTDKPLAHKSWEKPHIENLTGTALAYAPRGSIRQPKPMPRSDYEAWSPE